MDFLAFVNNLITSQQSALIAGLIAAFTPCTLAMMPIVLYRFGIRGDKKLTRNLVSLLVLIVTFVVSFTIAALVLKNILNGPLVNITRLALGTYLVYAAFLIWKGANIGAFLNRFSSPMFIGVVMPWAIGLSPCVLPWLTITTVASFSYGSVIMFGLGLVLPAVILAMLGSSAVRATRGIKSLSSQLEKIAPILLIMSGIYLMLQLLGPTTLDIFVTFGLIVVIYLYQTIQILRVKPLRTTFNYIFMILAAAVITAGLVLALTQAAPEALDSTEIRRFCIPGQDLQYRTQSINLAAIYSTVATMLGIWWLTQERPSSRLVVNFINRSPRTVSRLG